MISYAPLWETMKQKGVSQYAMRRKHGFSAGTMDSMKKGNSVSTNTIEELCRILDCRVEDVMVYIPGGAQTEK